MAKGWIKIKTSIPSSEKITGIDAAVIVSLRDLDDNICSSVSIMSSNEIGAREALVNALPAIADKLRSFGRCGEPGCEACDHAFRIAATLDAITGITAVAPEDAAMASMAKH
jgi:hypothetical protein